MELVIVYILWTLEVVDCGPPPSFGVADVPVYDCKSECKRSKLLLSQVVSVHFSCLASNPSDYNHSPGSKCIGSIGWILAIHLYCDDDQLLVKGRVFHVDNIA